MSIAQVFNVGPLRVLVDSDTGAILAVQDALTGAAAALMYSQHDIAHAAYQATLAWASTAELA